MQASRAGDAAGSIRRCSLGTASFSSGMDFASRCETDQHFKAGNRRGSMLKFLGGTIGVIFLIGLIVVILLLMLIF